MQTTEHYERIKQFMQLAKQDTPENPIMPDLKTRKLRAALILEEVLETIEGLGLKVVIELDEDKVNGLLQELDEYEVAEVSVKKKKFTLVESGKPNLKDIADGIADISVVSIGTLVACGVTDKGLLEMVDQNNLEKFGPGHSYREDGKLIKPKGHKPPDIQAYIDAHFDEED
jgi:predicted HAD superfamily Cof-like phosphohydrolase